MVSTSTLCKNLLNVKNIMAGSLLSFFLAGAVAGSLAGGWLGDRFGHKHTAVSMLSFATIPTAVFYLSGELNILTLIALFLIAACLMGAQPSSIIWAQRLLPQHVISILYPFHILISIEK